MYCCVVAVHAGDGKPEAGVLGEPDEVTLWVEGDFRDFVEDDAGVVGVVCRPSGSVVADEADVTGGGYP